MNKYKAIRVDGVKCDEHRYFMEQHLGRKLTSKEVVHHKDGIKSNNDLSNLVLMDISDHVRLHNGLRPRCGNYYKGYARRTGMTKTKLRILIACINRGYKQKRIAKLFDVSIKFVRNIQRKDSWAFDYFDINASSVRFK